MNNKTAVKYSRILRSATGAALCLAIVSSPDPQVALAQSNFKASAGSTTRREKLKISDPATAKAVAESGGELIADYGAFKVYQVPTATANALGSPVGAETITEQNSILLNAGPLDTSTAEVIASRQAVAGGAAQRLHLVQFAGPIKPEWRNELEATGVRIVAYIPNNAYLVYGSGDKLATVQTWAAGANYVQWEGAYLDAYKIQPGALSKVEVSTESGAAVVKPLPPQVYAIQLVKSPTENAATLQLISTLKVEPVRQEYEMLDYVNVVVQLEQSSLKQLAAQPEVISIALYPEPRKFDERQDQIMAGNLAGSLPSAPGYLAWLASKGFSQGQFTSSAFAIDLSDSGLDNGTTSPGHFGLYVGGDTNQPSRVAYNRLVGTPHSGSTLQGCDGHGTLNSHIMAGYNDQPVGFPHTDTVGFHYGLGVCPFVRVGSSVIFDPSSFTSPNYANLQSQAYNDGARISGNSWGAATSGSYNVDSQSYDALVRDAQPSGSTFPAVGNQEMVIVFAAGNNGSGSQTVGSPGTAKNVITVGAAENVHSHSSANGGADAAGNDGCAEPDTGADSANDIISFSSRGPCTDGRKKPDLVAPGTHITGGVAQNSPPPSPSSTGSSISCFDGTGVCALTGGGTLGSQFNYFPLGQQFFTTSSGTSHSTPAIAGSAALLRQYFLNQSLNPPSPAMTKAYLINSARYMNGVGANDTLPSNNQGLGEVNLGVSFDSAARVLRDELTIEKFTATGQTRTYAGVVADTSKPFRVTVAWTDAPGSTTGNAYNNNLDLTVTVGGNTYLGNVFSGANSIPGGTADAKNNTESVFLPAGVSGSFVITVTAANINSDGVPNEAPTTDQDYALVIYNAEVVPTPVLSSDSAMITAEGCGPTNGVADPGETISLAVVLRNVGTSNTTSVVATMLATNGVTFPSAPQTYGTLIAGGDAVTQSFSFTATGDCGGTIAPQIQLQDGTNSLGTLSLSLPLGVLATVFSENFDAAVVPSLPAGWATTATGSATAWVTSATLRDTLPNAAFAPDATAAGVSELVSAPIVVPANGSQLTFRHNYVTESGFDGGVLEIKVGAGAFTDILTGGGSFVSGGYNTTISSGTANPLTGRAGWSGSSGGFVTTIVNLPASAAGQNVQFRWRIGSDASVGNTGWYLDTVSLKAPSCCGAVAPPIAAFSAASTVGGAPFTATFTDTSFGSITNHYWDFGNGVTTNTTATTMSAYYPVAGTYTVSLTTSGGSGTNTLTRPAYIVVTNNFVASGYSIVAESCPNGALDPVEKVTLNITLRNTGTLPSSNLVATLQTSGGLLFPSEPQVYGAVPPSGGTASQPFTFTLTGSCGSTNLATLQLQDGAVNLGTVSLALPLGQLAPTFVESFDGVAAPALPAGWTTATSGAQSLWVTTASTADTAPNSVFSPNPASVGVNELVTPVLVLPSGPAKLTFRNNYNTESGFDGGVLEIKIGGGAFTDIVTAGGSFVSGGYNRSLSASYSNPLGGRQAWSGNSGGYTNTIVTLPTSAAGQSIQLRWRCGSDSSLSATGWRIDSVSLTTLACCSSPAQLIVGPAPAQWPVSFSVSVLGNPSSAYAIEGTTNFSDWTVLGYVTNVTGTVSFTDTNSPLPSLQAYRARLLP